MRNYDLKRMTNAQLLAALSAIHSATAENVQRQAELWCEADERRLIPDSKKTPLTDLYPDIAKGRLLPELWLRYAFDTAFLRECCSLVPEDQRKLASDDFKVAVARADGPPVQVVPIGMTIAQRRQVFGDGRIRSVKEQAKFLVPPHPVRARPALVAQTVSESVDLAKALSPSQLDLLRDLARAKGMSPAAWVVDALVRNRLLAEPRRQRAAA